ncbi:MAG: hypothetical protein JXR96_03875 [Deltaproteobacteria bacterium]|nr:hypothetical protein [Deltaproteobacteria bacterium]
MRMRLAWSVFLILSLSFFGCSSDSTYSPGETTAAACQDGQDNDSDSLTDCDDDDCAGYVFCMPPVENTASLCSDRADNDRDGDTDCDDTDCGDLISCAMPTEDVAVNCQDGADNDEDGDTDCDDPDCQGFVFCFEGAEDRAALCQDGADNDEDGSTDCDDTDCQGFAFCAEPQENTPEACRDRLDNDGDTRVDCQDTDCQGFTFCMATTENTASLCQDGFDNDHDNLTDCGDPDCLGFVFCYSTDETLAITCQDGQDNDGDTLTDCDDPDCQGFVFCDLDSETSPATCQDGADNDGDLLTDCDDPDCQGFVFCMSDESTSAACQDGEDNDSDMLTDCDDPDCQGFVFCLSDESTSAACQDGQDNDDDGQTDCLDTDCQGFTFCAPETENTAATCRDAVDNDQDNQTDCDDPDCQGFVFCLSEESTAAACQDGADNDDDGDTDCDDVDCQGFVFCLSAESTAAACQDGADNDDDGDTDCDDPDCQGFVFCSSSSHESTWDTCQDGLDNDFDDDTDCEDMGCWAFGFCHHYNGFPIVDSWGETWDGIERTAATWAAAQAECEALGGRLPTITELWRNNATNGTGDLTDNSQNNWMWTLISDYQGNRIVVQLGSGSISNSTVSSVQHFRCVWPDRVSDSFDGDYCFGPPGAECTPARRFYNVDSWDRPAVDLVAASHECNFYNGSIPVLQDWTEMIISGDLTGDWNHWLWSGDIMYYSGASPYILNGIVHFQESNEAYWTFDSTSNSFGSWQWPTSTDYFRCMGKRSSGEGVDPPSPSCQGGCFTITPSDDQSPDHAGRRAPIWADSTDRTATTRDGAAAICDGVGGSLPTVIEVMELVHAGWPNGTDAWLWTSNPVYHGNYQNLLARWNGTGYKSWRPQHSGTVSWNQGNGNYNFRCVWHQTYQTDPVGCPVGEHAVWDGSEFTCAPDADGDDQGAANGGGWTDPFGNVWDSVQRGVGSWDSALQICELSGGRLPTATELWRVRANGSNPIPNSTAEYLWTNLPSYRGGYMLRIRTSDGAYTDGAVGTNYYYRCIWPAETGNVFSSDACNGNPGSAGSPADPCWNYDRTTMDELDRATIYGASAAAECFFYGGWLTGLRDFEAAIHAGAPNGDWNLWSWLMEPAYSSNFYRMIGRWSGQGVTSWFWNNQVTSTGSLSGVTGRTFRCHFDDILR